MVEQHEYDGGIRLFLRPNNSLSWRDNVRIWAGMSFVSLLIVSGMFLAGAWLILPFAGLEISALGAALYYTSRQCQKLEVLDISAQSLHLEKGLNQKEFEWDLPRQYTRVQASAPPHPWTPPKLSLSHRNLEIPLGAFLNLDDTQALIRLLERHGLRVIHQHVRQPFWF